MRDATDKSQKQPALPGRNIAMSTGEEKKNLTSLLEEDKGRVMQELSADRSAAHAQAILDKEMDRLMLRAAQVQDDEFTSQTAQYMLQSVKNTLPLVKSVTDSQEWQKVLPANLIRKRKTAASLPPMLLIAAGAGAAVAGSLIWSLAGCVLIAAGGFLLGKAFAGEKTSGGADPGSGAARQEEIRSKVFLVDPDHIWHVLQGAMMTADRRLEDVEETIGLAEINNHQIQDGELQENGEVVLQNRKTGAGAGRPAALVRDDLDFFAELLENAYARKRRDPQDRQASEMAENIRYYLHERGIETADYASGQDRWFEFLPGGSKETIRPAFLRDGQLVRKGLAS